MRFIPAIDVKEGKCVRLRQGLMTDFKQYAINPKEAIEKYGFKSAKCVHIVDLDGATNGHPCNLTAIQDIVSCFDGFVQVGGGIRKPDDVELYLAMGVTKVVLGTSVIENPMFVYEMCNRYPGRVCIGVDTVNKFVTVNG